MGRPIIRILDPVHCKANKEARAIIKKALMYKASEYKRNRKTGAREQITQTRHLITGRKGSAGTFLTGLLPRVLEHANKKKKRIMIINRDIDIPATAKPKVEGIKFRRDQRKALRAVRRRPRGKIVFPTGSGKTIIALGIMSMFPNCRILFLCHLKDLLFQTMHALERHKFKNFEVIGGGYKVDDLDKLFKRDKCIVLSTIQSFSNIPKEKHFGFFDITIVDEEHHVNKKSSMYGQVMETNLSPRRYGLTATEPTDQYEILMNEGYFGPVIAELTITEGIELGIIAKPIINLVPVPYNVNINKKCEGRYKKFYENGIVKNRMRNKIIIDEVVKSLQTKEIVLIIIERQEHGKILQKMLKYKGLNIPFIFGETKKEKRIKTKNQLQKKELQCAICSRVWKEGINIPSLNHIINACGMKEEKMVLQAIGRGLRTTDEKTTVKVTDFLDPYRYLAEHSIIRTSIYIKKGWL